MRNARNHVKCSSIAYIYWCRMNDSRSPRYCTCAQLKQREGYRQSHLGYCFVIVQRLYATLCLMQARSRSRVRCMSLQKYDNKRMATADDMSQARNGWLHAHLVTSNHYCLWGAFASYLFSRIFFSLPICNVLSRRDRTQKQRLLSKM